MLRCFSQTPMGKNALIRTSKPNSNRISNMNDSAPTPMPIPARALNVEWIAGFRFVLGSFVNNNFLTLKYRISDDEDAGSGPGVPSVNYNFAQVRLILIHSLSKNGESN